MLPTIGVCLLLIGGQFYFQHLAQQAESGLHTLYAVRGAWNYAFVDSVRDLLLYSTDNDLRRMERMQAAITQMNVQQNAWGQLLNGDPAFGRPLMFERYGSVNNESRSNLALSLQRAQKLPLGPRINRQGYRMDADLAQFARLANRLQNKTPQNVYGACLAIYELNTSFTRRNVGDMMRTGAAIQLQIALFDRLHSLCNIALLLIAAIILTRLSQRLRSREEDLQGSREKLALIAQATNDAIWEYDALAGKMWINDQFAEVFGVKDRDHFRASDAWALLHSSEREETRQSFFAAIARRDLLWRRDQRMRRPDGRYVVMAIRAGFSYDENGRYVRVLGGMRDITQRREAEQRLQLLFERNATGILRTDAEGRVLECNEALCRMIGYDDWAQVRAVGETNIYVEPAQKQRLIDDLKAGRETRYREVQLRHRDGSVRTVLATPILMPTADGGQACIECVIQDVTQLRRLQEELLQAQKMEAIGRLAGGVAHDFNNLLMVMGSYAQMLLRVDDAAKRRNYAEHMIEATKRGAALTGQLLSFSRKQVMQAVTLDVNLSVRHLAELLPRVLGEDIALELRLSAEPLHTRIDPSYFDQVIMNLAVNARDAMPHGGRLVIETERATDGPEPCVTIAVTDTGEGIDPAMQERIFEPFFTSKPPGKGTGLGLATVYGVVRQNGGHITVDSKPGAGACFRVFLPLCGALAKKNREETADEVRLPAIRILLAEDEPDVRQTVAEHLRAGGCAVDCVASGAEARDRLQSAPQAYDLLLTDVIMPELNGRELAEEAQKLRPGLRVLFMSGYADNILPHEQQGINFLQKPFPLEQLSERIVRLFSSSDA